MWGVFKIGVEVISYVVKKITPKMVKKYGEPISRHKTADVAKKTAKNKKDQAKKAADKAAEKERKDKAAKIQAQTKKDKAEAKARGDKRRSDLKQKRGEERTGIKTETQPRRMTDAEIAAARQGLAGKTSGKTSAPSKTKTGSPMGTAVKELAKDPKTLAAAAGVATLASLLPKGRDRKLTGSGTEEKPEPKKLPAGIEKMRPAPDIATVRDATAKAKAKAKPLTNAEIGAHFQRIDKLRISQERGAGLDTVTYDGKEYDNWKEYDKAWREKNKGRERPEDPVKTAIKKVKKKITGKKGGGRVSSRPTNVMRKMYAKGGSVRKPKKIK